MPQTCDDMGQMALLPLRRKACWGFFRPKNPAASVVCEPANLGTKGQHATSTYTQHINAICGRNVEYFMLNNLAHKETTGPLKKVNILSNSDSKSCFVIIFLSLIR
jgi:hypothetical protein